MRISLAIRSFFRILIRGLDFSRQYNTPYMQELLSRTCEVPTFKDQNYDAL